MKRTILSLALLAAVGAAYADLGQAYTDHSSNVESGGGYRRASASAGDGLADPPFQETKYPPGAIMSIDGVPVPPPDYGPVERFNRMVVDTLGDGFYVGAGIAQLRTNWADINVGSTRSASSTGYRIYLGRQFSKFFGVEGEYLGAGTQDWEPATAIPGKPVNAGLQLKPAHIGLFATVRPFKAFALGDYGSVSAFVKAGAVYNLASAKASAIYSPVINVGPGFQAPSSAQSHPGLAKRLTPSVGFGFDWSPSWGELPWAFRVEYQYQGGQEVRADSPAGTKLISTDSHVIGLSATYSFY